MVLNMSLMELLKQRDLLNVLFAVFMFSFGFGIILPILPFYSISFGATPFELGLLTATFAFMSLILSPVFGKIADSIGRKKVLAMGTTGFIIAYIVFAFADSLFLVFVARAIEGVSAAAMFPSAVSLISDYSTEKTRGAAMSLMGMAFSLGFILGPAFGGLASHISIPIAFFLAALLSLTNTVLVVLFLKEPKEKEESKDIAQKEFNLLSHLKSRTLLFFAGTFMLSFLIGGLEAVFALFTFEKFGFGSGEVGLVFMYIGVLIFLGQLVSAKLLLKYRETTLIKAGFLMNSTGFLGIFFAPDMITLGLTLGLMVLGNSFSMPSVISMITKRVEGKRGAILGLNASFQSLGQLIGPIFAGFLFGISHIFSFIGIWAVLLGYFVIFTLFGFLKKEF
ncbi:MAG: MFS transporter [archaeon]|nr:MFS transporter [archaeon]